MVRIFYKSLMNKQFTLRATMMLAVISTIIGIGVTPILLQQQSVNGLVHTGDLQKGVVNHEEQITKAPITTSGDNVYIAWWTNKTGNNEVTFRASSDGGKTFGDKINLSNSTINSERTNINNQIVFCCN